MKLPLTISLLASNRVASLERCLDSLKPLLQKVPAELIVVFTGTEEGVRQVAARYTDQIIPFTWCDDFSAARNEGLKHAKGEWFLYLDDDEWFDDVTEICDFFQSGEYKKYNSAGYIQRNYLHWNGARYSDYIAFRMAKRTKALAFHNPIHEELLPFEAPCKIFGSYVHHYGYLKETTVLSDGKSKRNIPLLQEDIKRRPNYTKNYVQLTLEYCVEQKWELAEETCRQGLNICAKEEVQYRSWLQSYLVEILYRNKAYDKAEKEALLIIEKESPCELVRLLLYLMLITICEEKGICEKTLKYGEEFETLLSYMEQHPQLWNEQRVANIGRDKVMNPDWLYPARLSCVRAALELSDREKAECFLRLLPWDKEYMIEQYYPLLDQWKETYAALLPELLASLLYDSQYLLMQRLFLSEDPFLFHRCLKEIAHPYLLQQLIKKAFRSKYDLSILLDRMDLESWKQCISGVVKETSYTEIEFLWEAQEALRADYLLQKLWFKKLLLEKELSMGFLMKKALLETLEEYARCVQAFYEGQYQEFMLQEDFRYLLPSECRLSFVLLEALDFWKQGRLTETIRCLRMALQVDPQMTGVVREVIRILNLEIAHPAPAAGAEFEQLAVQMKAALRTMADNGQYSEAMQVLSQLLPLLPDDMELLKLQQRLLAEMKD